MLRWRINFAIVFLVVDLSEGDPAPFVYFNAKKITEVQPGSDEITEGRRFCGWFSRSLLSEECIRIATSPLFKSNHFQMIEGRQVRDMRFIRAQKYSCFTRVRHVAACRCPTEPPMYLMSKVSEDEPTTVIISQRKFVRSVPSGEIEGGGDGTGAGCSKCSSSVSECKACCSKMKCSCFCDKCCESIGCNEERAEKCGKACGKCLTCGCLCSCCLGREIICLPVSAVRCVFNCASCIIYCPCVVLCGMRPPQLTLS